MSARPRIVVLDDYEQLLRKSGDWASVDALADVVVHHERLRSESLLAAIRDADAIVVIRDRTPFKAELLAQLPKLRFFSFTGGRNTTMDAAAFMARGIPVTNTEMGSSKESTAELAWTLILAAAKRLEAYLALVRRGQWRDGRGLPAVLAGERLGIIGFGDIGQRVGRVGQAFGMELVCWSPNMTPERAAQGGGEVAHVGGFAENLEGGEPQPRAQRDHPQAPERGAPGAHANRLDPGEHGTLGADRHGGVGRRAGTGAPRNCRAGCLR